MLSHPFAQGGTLSKGMCRLDLYMDSVDNSDIPIVLAIVLMLKFASNPYVEAYVGNKNKN